MKKLVLIFLLILIPYPVQAYQFCENWTKTDTSFESIYVGLTIIDWGQTRDIAKHPQQYSEMNPFLGKHPSLDKVDTIIPLGIVAHGLVSMALPPKYRRYWQVLFIGGEIAAVWNNYNVGLRIDF
jgi:hypothetical protein